MLLRLDSYDKLISPRESHKLFNLGFPTVELALLPIFSFQQKSVKVAKAILD
jgi:hypothetical protein